jgi:8-oxo-dGTP pyrophosphatase MutT (NUDIX family)
MSAIELKDFQRALEAYMPEEEEEDFRIRMLTLLQKGPLAFSREMLSAHFTASAWIVETSTPSVLLLHHRKLDRWLQPGGHADGELQLGKVAHKEALEETGLNLPPVPLEAIFDLDIHQIPEHKGIPAHHHYDVRFLFLLPQKSEVKANHESRALAWVPLDEVAEKTGEEPSILRLVRKSRAVLHGKPKDL